MYSVFLSLISCSSGRIKHNMHRNALPRSTKLYQAFPSSTKHYQALSCPYFIPAIREMTNSRILCQRPPTLIEWYD